jgi:hypothetical protein
MKHLWEAMDNCQALDHFERELMFFTRGRGLDLGEKMWYNLISSANMAILHGGEIMDGTSAV